MVTSDVTAISQVKRLQRTYNCGRYGSYVAEVMTARDRRLHGRERDLRDRTLEREIELLGEMLAAAAEATTRLTEEQIDEALGLHAPQEGPPPAAGGPGAGGLPCYRFG